MRALNQNLIIFYFFLTSFSFAVCAEDRPNIIMLLTDDWGYFDNSKYSENVKYSFFKSTPHLDALADKGMLFTQYRSASPVCSPARVSLLTGRFPAEVGYQYISMHETPENQKFGVDDFLSPKLPTVAGLLKRVGYKTGHFGKWHMGATKDSPAPENYGFDETNTFESNPLSESRRMVERVNIPSFPSRSSSLVVNETIKFIDRVPKDQPFYVNVWFHVAHAPIIPTREQVLKIPYKMCGQEGTVRRLFEENAPNCPRRDYVALVHDCDHHIGRLLSHLQHTGRMDNTFIMFTSDNGPETAINYKNSQGQTFHLRGHKRSLYDGGVRVPFIAYWPGHIPAGTQSRALINSVDWLPTVCAIVGIDLSQLNIKLSGTDISPVLFGKASEPNRTIRQKWVFPLTMAQVPSCLDSSPGLSIIDHDLKIKVLVEPDFSRIEVYNISTVKGLLEFNDLYSMCDYHPLISSSHVTSLANEVIAWYKGTKYSSKYRYGYRNQCHL